MAQPFEDSPRGVVWRIASAVREESADHITLSGVLERLGSRAGGYVLLLLALPACMPGVPGMTSIFGVPLALLGIQMIRGGGARLPDFIARRPLPRAGALKALETAAARLRPLERRLRPRWSLITHPGAERLLGALILALALLIAVPLPMTNMAPAFGATIIGLGLAAGDGLVVALGVILGLGSVVFVGGLTLAAVAVALPA
ncbi:MAG: exopolysaccharide biosynthesis protein [Phenylobacterium sp.]|uniref:exopolysaccharide biosynthesis protein n=1 Tax=Phenylobacterium sp. TaxID=1871053 RepID=UPI00391BC41A